MQIWIDDIRPAPEGYFHCRSVNEVKEVVTDVMLYENGELDELDFDYLDDYTPGPHILHLDHDAGVYAADGGDYINILNYLEFLAHNGMDINFKFAIHSFNPVGCVNMRAIMERNGWEEIR